MRFKVLASVGAAAVGTVASVAIGRVYSNWCGTYCAVRSPNDCTFGIGGYCTGPLTSCDVGWQADVSGGCMDTWAFLDRNCYTFNGPFVTAPCAGAAPQLYGTNCGASPGTSTCWFSTTAAVSQSSLGTMQAPTSSKKCGGSGGGWE